MTLKFRSNPSRGQCTAEVARLDYQRDGVSQEYDFNGSGKVRMVGRREWSDRFDDADVVLAI